MKNHKLKERKRRTDHIFFKIFFFFFIGGYTFFFTSSLWMSNAGSAKRITTLNKNLEWNNRSVSILRWDYSPEQKLMEVELQIVNKKFDEDNTYKFSARESRGSLLTVDTVIEEPDWIILQIHDIPKKFLEISLRMEMEEIQNSENSEIIKLYTNINDVKHVAEISKKDRIGYMTARLQSEAYGYENDIKELNKSIKKEKNRIKAIQKEIIRMEEKSDYQTEKELELTNQLIMDAQTEIESASDNISKHTADIKEYEERIKNIEEKASLLQEDSPREK